MQLTNVRERILQFGGEGMGKSFDFFTIARLAAETGSDAHFYVVDTENASGKTLTHPYFEPLWGEDYSELPNISIYNVTYWEQLLETLEEIQGPMSHGQFMANKPGLMGNNDWLLLDSLTITWTWVQDWFTDRVFHKDLNAFFLAAREAMKPGDKKANGLEGWKDFSIINAQYFHLYDRIIRSPGHVFATAEVKAFDSGNADKEDRALYGGYGFMAAGQKKAGHRFDTVLWRNGARPAERPYTTLKDRARDLLNGAELEDFAQEYLVGVAGWTAEEPKTAAQKIAEAKAKKGVVS